jgi:selenide,water dikinase
MIQHPDLIVGAQSGDDAAVYRISDDTALIFTVDFFPPITDDPFQYGAIAAANALSDVYAMGGKPLMALNVVGFPADLAKDLLAEVLKGGYAKAAEAGCLIVGGHTVDDAEPKYGMAVIGILEPGKETSNAGAQPGDALVLTKPLGTGIITTAGKQNKVSEDVMQVALDTMATLNKNAAEAMIQVGVNACTDITGFGLLGHLRSMVRASGVGATVEFSKIPLLPGAWELLEAGIAPGGTHRNLDSVAESIQWHPGLTENQKIMLCDAQTSGGLLISVTQARLPELLSRLEAEGVATRAVVGSITQRPEGKISARP